jgi:hypothetical protein
MKCYPVPEFEAILSGAFGDIVGDGTNELRKKDASDAPRVCFPKKIEPMQNGADSVSQPHQFPETARIRKGDASQVVSYFDV